MATTALQPLIACRSAVARVAHSDPDGWLYIAFSPRLVNLGTGPAYDVRLDLHPVSRTELAKAGCRVWPGEPRIVEPQQQTGDATLIALERELADGLHVQQLAAGDLPASSFAIAIPDAALEELPAGWLPIFETATTSHDLDRPGRWECGLPSDLVYGVCTYRFGPDATERPHDHLVALPLSRIYVPAGWAPPACLVDTDHN
ncbi:MAG: hypothetical protein JWL76_211 [Thermoleophilia bacterium]|nr:hypothetical protein [Thermoleophilia bacterium]